MSFDQPQVSRRTVAKGAAWSVPAVAVAAAAPTLAASPCEATYQSVTKQFTYADTLGNDVIVTVNAMQVPKVVPAGTTLLPISTESTTLISSASAGLLMSFLLGGAEKVGGTSVSQSELTGALTKTTTSNLAIPITGPQADGSLLLAPSGTGDADTVPAGTAPGTVTITMGAPSSDLVGYQADGTTETGRDNTTLSKIDGNDYTLATFEIVAAC